MRGSQEPGQDTAGQRGQADPQEKLTRQDDEQYLPKRSLWKEKLQAPRKSASSHLTQGHPSAQKRGRGERSFSTDSEKALNNSTFSASKATTLEPPGAAWQQPAPGSAGVGLTVHGRSLGTEVPAQGPRGRPGARPGAAGLTAAPERVNARRSLVQVRPDKDAC